MIIEELKQKNDFYSRKNILDFLNHQHDLNHPGYYKYSYSGDLFDSGKQENIVGSIFALKLYAMLGVTDKQITKPITDRILSFQKSDGRIYDPMVYRKSYLRNALSRIKHFDFSNLDNHQYVRAETRQAYSALGLFGTFPEHVFSDVPTDQIGIRKYIQAFDWKRPWNAGSHFSHLMFFLAYLYENKKIDAKTFDLAKQTAIEEINKFHHADDGAWYIGNPSLREKINGAMKVITGLLWTEKRLENPEQLIDLCLSHKDSVHACDQINKTLVLRYANEETHGMYRRDDLVMWCEETLKDWQTYYHSDKGGFSFWKNRANDRYYDARITHGVNEPDIHGTMLFVWGLSMMAKLISIPELDWIKEIKS